MKRSTPASSEQGDRLRKAVAEAAQSLELETASEDLSRMIGVAFAPAAHSSVDVDETGEPAPFTDSDRDAIQKLLTDWHRVLPKDVLATWQQFATSPYYVADSGGLNRVTKKILASWSEDLNDPSFKEASKGFSPQNPRQVTFSECEVIQIAAKLAAATFQAKEVGQSGEIWMGNGAAMFVKDVKEKSGEYAGWKILVVAKGGDVYHRQ